MLEGLVATLLNRFLGMYVKNFDPKQLNVGIWSGDVVLRDLDLRREALDQLRLPVNVVEGHLGRLSLSIPWSNLRGKPVRVNIEDVFLLAAPREDADYDAEEDARRAQAVKMEKLENAELLKDRNTEGMSQEEQQKQQSFTSSMVTAIVDNLQISIKNIHIRYEDSIATPGHPFALGFTLREISAVSTDENWRPTFIQSTSGNTHKLATLGALSFYWNTDATLLGTGKGTDDGSISPKAGHEELMGRFRDAIENTENHQYILKPVSGRAGLEMDKTGKVDRPKIKARLLFDELGFTLDEDQYRDALMLVDLFHYFIRHQEYKKLQPKCSPKEDPKAWLKFAGQAVLTQIHDRNRRWTWDYFRDRRDDRIRYIQLFKKRKQEQKLTTDESSDLKRLEEKLSYEDLRFWRSLARNQLRKENVGVKKPPPKQSWSSWVWGSGQKEEQTENDTAITEEQRKELYNMIDWDEKKAIAESVDVPRDSVMLQVESSLRTGSFTLKRDPQGRANEILRLVFDNFQAKALQRPDSFLADIKLGGLRVYDGTTRGTLFPQIVRVKDVPAAPAEDEDETFGHNEDATDITQTPKDEVAPESLFHLQFEQNPLDGSADSAITMKLKSIEVIYNPKFIVEIAKFFKPPERHMESIGALMQTAGATVESIRQQTRAGLEFALEEHKTINAMLDIQAPLIIVPESIIQESTLCLIFDAGHVSLNSELVDKETLRDIQSKERKKYTDEDLKQLQGLMYDKFLLKLDSTQVLIGPGIAETKAQLEANDDSKNYHLIDRINMDFVLENCIIPKAADLTKTRVSGHLAVLHASISDKKYKNLMRLIDIAVPKFENEHDDFSAKELPSQSSKKHLTPKDERPRSRSRSKSFQRPASEQDLIMDDESADEGRSQAGSQLLQPDTTVNPEQRNFQFTFTVDKLQGSLYRSDPEEKRPDQLLAELVAEHFQFNFYLRPYDMIAETILKSLNVDDHVEQDQIPEFRKIISSKGFDAEEDKDLFSVRFIKVNKDSPEFFGKYEGIAMNLDASVSTINLIVTRRTILTLLDFVLVTFTSPGDDHRIEKVDDEKKAGGTKPEEQPDGQIPTEPDKIRIKANLNTISVILNNDGMRLATLSLQTADVKLLVAGKTMDIESRLGSLSLIDDINTGASQYSSLRQLITIQGDNFADFRYRTFDSQAKDYPGYDSEVFLRSGSVKVNFLEEPFRKIIEFAVKFGRMQAIFNAARQAAANQASQMQETASKMHFDIVVKTPIVVFPRIVSVDKPRDLVTANLGEIYANNSFKVLEVGQRSAAANRISAGIRNIRLTTEFHYENLGSEELEMLNKVDLDFKVTYVEHQPNLDRPDVVVKGSMSPINLCITQSQLKFLLGLSRTVPSAFATESEEEEQIVKELPRSTTEPAKTIMKTSTSDEEEIPTSPSYLGPELGKGESTWTKVDFVFNAETVGLELALAKEDEPVGNLESASLSQFALNKTNVKLRMMSDGALESELMVHSFTIKDSRKTETNKFRKIMSLINNNVKQQFMASFSMSGGNERNLVAMLTIDSPRVIFALDYLFALQSFATTAFASDEPAVLDDNSPPSSPQDNVSESTISLHSNSPVREKEMDRENEPASGSSITVSFRINVVDAQVMLIANPAISNSEAIVLGTKQVLLSQQNSTTLQVSKIGMFLCRMDKFETSRLRILDDFDVQLSMESKSGGRNASLTRMELNIDPLILRLSLRDILLALQIVNKASEMTNQGQSKIQDSEPKKIKEIKGSSTASKRRSAGGKPKSLATKTTNKSAVSKRWDSQAIKGRLVGSGVMKREELSAKLHGMRVILIGDRHELPLIDWSVKEFKVDVRDWSAAMAVDFSIDTFINVYNFSKSAWEPLIEPWQLGFHMSKEESLGALSVELYSHKVMELTATSATIALASKSMQFLSTDEDVLSKPRGQDAPFRIRNYTGFDLSVWASSKEDDQGTAAKLSDGEEYPWRFEDPTKMRQNLNPEGNAGLVGVKLEGSGFDSIDRIPVGREGETLYNLKPRKDRILHRLLVDVKLGADSVKYITFRSPLLVENRTQIPIELGVFSPEDGHLLKIEKIKPGEGRPAPVGAAFLHSLIVRPDQGFGYAWSNERLFWKDLLKRPSRTITCQGENQSDQSPSFFFQMHAAFDKNDPITGVYPYMQIRISAPIELQNLLPYNFKYRIYDRNTKKDWTNFLRKGGISPVHVVELSHLLLLSIDMQDTVFKPSDFAIINSSAHEDFRRENELSVKDQSGIELKLKLHYFNVPDSGGAFKVTVYSPYLVLNRTGLDLNIQSKSMFQAAKASAGQSSRTEIEDEERRVLPYMFSYPNDDRKNRATLKIGDSGWSKPQTFDAIGSDYEVVLPSSSRGMEMHVGVSVKEGEGKYNVTKVVTVAPRFILKNKINEEINIREPGSSETMSLSPGELLPLRFLRQAPEKQLCLCFPGINNQWSSPFNISNVGTVHVKLAKAGERQKLIRIEVIMEKATIFLHIGIETKHWPFSMRNESDMEFMFYQTNPYLDEDEEDQDTKWRPIRYRLPPRSIMPYAWDYPAAKNKEIVLTCLGKSRNIKLAEIGNLLPIRIPLSNGQQKIIDLNIIAEGPTQTLALSKWKPSQSLYKQKSGTSSQASISTGFEVKDFETDVTFKAQLRFAGIGISLVNKHLKELLYMTLRQLELKYHDSKLYQTVNATIKWIQIDNQLYGGIFPILLYPSVVPKTGKEMEAHPIFHAAVTRVKDDSYGVLYIKYATMLLQQMTIEIDEDFIFAMIDFADVPGASWTEEREGKLCDDDMNIPEPQKKEQGQDVYFELLHLQPMQLDLSFVRTERINAEDNAQATNPLMFAFNVMTMSIGNVNDAPVRFNALMLENARVSVPALTANIQRHYTQEFLSKIHIVLGSADFIGNPVGLFNNFSSGVADIFYEPYQGLVMTDRPQELGIGIAKGASSFVKKSVFGLSDSMAKFTGSVSKGLAAATLDKEFQDKRRMSKSRNRPKHALYGITAGGNAFATSLASGIGGLARHPLQGAEKEGLQGFVKGVGKGFLGLATKPAIGAFDLASNLAEGVRNTTTVFDAEGLDRVRLARFIGIDGVVRPYSQREALGQFWLKTMDDGKHFNENYIAHLELPGRDMLVMLTYNRIMLVKSKRLRTEWDIKLTDIQTISKERTGMSVTLKGGTNGPFIPVQEESSRNWLYKQIAIAVNAFNDKYNTKG
ncbi:MAG: hypothetical protein M1834_002939 [Cirrosporium novae-zelandiae]|nr:MAG: hypothetical protein M1834_002939 [Cirrosporium novae-zelandiae]